MPIEVRRFGVGHRRPDGPPGTVGIEGQVIHGGADGTIAELAFGRSGRIAPHSNPNTTYLIVIEGGGWVQVGEERTRVLAGEAVLWPAGVVHAAWTDGAPMRALVVELPGAPTLLEGRVRQIGPGEEVRSPAARGEGRLAPRPATRDDPRDPEAAEGEPR